MDVATAPKGRGITVTFKYGKGYEETWAVFAGLPHEVRDDIIAYFGIDRESVSGLTLNSVVVNATQIAHGVGAVAAGLGGVVISEGSAAQASPAASGPVGESAWKAAEARAASAPAEPEPNPLLKQISDAPNVDALKRIWATNQAAFAEPELMAAWKARGKALSAPAR